MTERPTIAVGLMSGTSLDGMDAAIVEFNGPTKANLLAFTSVPYSQEERTLLERAPHDLYARDLALLHARLSRRAVEAVAEVLTRAKLSATDLAFIAYPGHTMWHEPPAVSWQIGEPAILAEAFGVRVVHNFRARDVAAGGEGAPLVPVADVLLYADADRPRVLLNLGGIANLTYAPGRAEESGVLAFDTGPGMMLIDAVARAVDATVPFDVDGRLAARGEPNLAEVNRLLDDPFFERPPPKSTGRERFGPAMAADLVTRIDGPGAVATAVALTVESIILALSRWVPPVTQVIVSGGGRHHPGLMRLLEDRLSGVWSGTELHRFDDLFYDGDAKEAVAFALLGYLTVHGQPGNLPQATGAKGPRVLGALTPP